MEDIIIEERPVPAVKKTEALKAEKIKKIKKTEDNLSWFAYLSGWVCKSLIIAAIVSINFLWFCQIGNIEVFNSGIMSPEVKIVLSGIALGALIVVFMFSFSRLMENILAALTAGLFVVVLLEQYALFDASAFLYPFSKTIIGAGGAPFLATASQWVVGGLIALLVWLFLSFASRWKVAFFTLILLAVAAGLGYQQYREPKENQDFQTVYEDKVFVPQNKGKKFVYIALPRMSSFSYLKDISEDHPSGKTALNAMLGFWAKNQFLVYPNAYANTRDGAVNLAQTLNLTDDPQIDGYVLADVENKKNWNFAEINLHKKQLKNNKLFDNFNKAGYVVSVFDGQLLNMCYKNNMVAANECLRKYNLPLQLDQQKFSLRQRATALLGQWLESMNIIPEFPKVYKFVETTGRMNEIPLMGATYKDLSAVNAIRALDVVVKDITEVRGNKAYFINLNLPGNMYVYDEFCQLKPMRDWMSAAEKVYGQKQDLLKRRDAYFEQTACLYGKLTDFMKKVKDAGDAEQTVVMIQGMSGIGDLNDAEFPENFENAQSIVMAIRDPLHKKFAVAKNICSAPDIVKQYFFKNDKCTNFNGLDYNSEQKDELEKWFGNNKFYKKNTLKAVEEFEAWYRNWLRANYPDMIIPIEMPALEEAEVEKSKLVNPAKVKEIKTEQKVKKFADAVKEEAVKEINYVNDTDPNLQLKETVVTKEEDTGTKVIIKIGADESLPETNKDDVLLENNTTTDPEQIIEEENGALDDIEASEEVQPVVEPGDR